MAENSCNPRWENYPKSILFSVSTFHRDKNLVQDPKQQYLSASWKFPRGVIPVYCQFWLGAKLGNSGTGGKLEIGECV